MTGPPGKFMSVIPKVIIFFLAASLWEAFLPCLTDCFDRQRSGRAILDSIRSRINTFKNPRFYKLNGILSGPPVGKPVAVRVMGDDFQTLKSISHKVMAELGSIRDVTDIENDFNPGKDEIRIIVDEERGALFDLNVPAFT